MPASGSSRSSLRLLLPFIREQRWLIIIGLVSLIIVNGLQLFIPRVIKWAVDDLTSLQISPSRLTEYGLIVVAIAVGMGLFRFVWRRCLLGNARRVEEGLRNRLFEHLQTLSASYFDRTKTGDLMAHATNDLQQIRMATGMGLVAINDAIFLGLAAVGFMAAINIRLTLYVLLPMPLIVAGTTFFSRKLHKRYKEVQARFSDMTEVVRERLAGLRLIRAYSLEEHAASEVNSSSSHYIDANVQLARIVGLFFPLMLLLTNMSLALVLLIGGRQTILGEITPGDFVAFINYLGLITWPMMAMGWVINLLQRGRASLDRIDRILQTRPDVADRPEAKPLQSARPDIVFDAVRFTYPTGSSPALEDISLEVGPGRTLGLVGPPGSGKSTLLHLIPRLYDVERGAVRLDGRDIRDLPLGNLRDLVAYVPQDPFLFSGTIRENILLSRQEPSSGDLEAILHKTDLEDTLAAMPRGLDTVVGERGVILSGGQKQRVALARGLLKPAPILLLDDPVSQVDLETANRILSRLSRDIEERTVIIASHRIAAIHFAHRVITLQEGRIAEQGSMAELLQESQGFFARVHRLQQLEEELYAL
jgi:ATP-binding cassette subfamily B protein